MSREDKLRYEKFCEKTYVPIFSKPWWMDAVCGPQNWDVWLYEQGGEIVAAMPYYLEKRRHGIYITKAPLTQNNGLIINYSANSTPISRQKQEEKIVDAACAFIESLGLAAYEQQFHHTFTNWSPYYWNGYTAMPRYTYVIEDTSDIDNVFENISRGHRKNIRKGNRNGELRFDLETGKFYQEHEKIFAKQGLPCPFSRELWSNLRTVCEEKNAGRVLYAVDERGEVASLMFLVWDDRAAYPLLGGSMPGLQTLETYSMLTWESIKIAHDMGLQYDFEGSMIKRIARSFREYGGVPKLYFRIRKVFSPEVIRMEAEQQIGRLMEAQ